MKNLVFPLRIVIFALIYAYTQRYEIIKTTFENYEFILRYDSLTQELCTLNNTELTRRFTGRIGKDYQGKPILEDDYLPIECEQPAYKLKFDKLDALR